MSLRLKPYSEYKDSGAASLGQVPGHWEIGPGFAAFREKRVKNSGMQEKTVLSLSYGRIVVKPPEKLHGLVPESFETYQIAEPGDIIIRATDLQNDHTSLRVGLVRNHGIITSAYLCFRTPGKLSSDYGYLLLHAFDLMKVFYGMGSGLRQNLDFRDFKRMIILVPPPAEQVSIVRFVDWANMRLERAIRVKRKIITLLGEQRQAIIYHAVKAYQNAMKNGDKQNARIEHDKALQRVLLALLSDHTELFKQFQDNPNFKKWLADTVFAATYSESAPEQRQ